MVITTNRTSSEVNPKVEQPQPRKIPAPNFLCLPLLVKGMPVFLDILCLARVIPRARFQEKPPRFGISHLKLTYCKILLLSKVFSELAS